MTRKMKQSGQTDNILIRPEAAGDQPTIHAVTKAAFEGKPYAGGNEADIVDALRDADALTCSLVAELDGQLIGHVAFSPMSLNGNSSDWFGLGPISVLPLYQRQGLGGMLALKGLQQIKEKGAVGCALLGNPKYYSRFGFQVADQFTCQGPPAEYFQTLTFQSPTETGNLQFHPAFSTKKN